MRKLLIFCLLLGFLTGKVNAQFVFSGKVRTTGPTHMELTDVYGNVLLKEEIKSGEPFKYGPLNITQDCYKLKIGKVEKLLVLENAPLEVKGFLDPKSNENSILQFQGSPLSDSLVVAERLFKVMKDRRWNWSAVDKRYHIAVLAGIIYQNEGFFKDDAPIINDVHKRLEQDMKASKITQWMSERVKRAAQFVEGATLVDFKLPDQNGKVYSTADFKGKLVLLDFWASWCGPCRKEMKSLQKIYEEIKGEDLVFVSVSLDEDKERWLKALQEDGLPWLALWDDPAMKNGSFWERFGFQQIPFIMLIGKDGTILARNLRGEEVKNEILKYR